MKKFLLFYFLIVLLISEGCFVQKPEVVVPQETDNTVLYQKIEELEQEIGRLKELSVDIESLKKLIDWIKLKQDMEPSRYFRPFIPDNLVFCNEEVPLDRFEIWERLEFAILDELKRSGMILAILRSGRWFPMIEQKIKELGLPEDLKYVAVIESYLHPGAVSGAGAVGMWQFIKSTAKHAGLKVNSYIDERYDPEKATEAALKHLKELYLEFGNWPSALAGYNMHKDKYRAEQLRERARDFYEVKDIPIETQRYPFRAMAVKLIMEYPQKYGFPLPEDLNKIKYAPYPIEAQMVVVAQGEKIIDLAKRLGMTYYEFRILNLHIRSTLPRGKYKIYIKKTQ